MSPEDIADSVLIRNVMFESQEFKPENELDKGLVEVLKKAQNKYRYTKGFYFLGERDEEGKEAYHYSLTIPTKEKTKLGELKAMEHAEFFFPKGYNTLESAVYRNFVRIDRRYYKSEKDDTRLDFIEIGSSLPTGDKETFKKIFPRINELANNIYRELKSKEEIMDI